MRNSIRTEGIALFATFAIAVSAIAAEESTTRRAHIEGPVRHLPRPNGASIEVKGDLKRKGTSVEQGSYYEPQAACFSCRVAAPNTSAATTAVRAFCSAHQPPCKEACPITIERPFSTRLPALRTYTPEMNTPFDDLEKTKIWLAEYNILQLEIINRMNNGFQLLAAGAIVFSLLVQMPKTVLFYWALGIAIAVFLIAGGVFLPVSTERPHVSDGLKMRLTNARANGFSSIKASVGAQREAIGTTRGRGRKLRLCPGSIAITPNPRESLTS